MTALVWQLTWCEPLQPIQWIYLGALMARQLPSRVFSSETLVEGLGVIRAEKGMDDLKGINVQEMQDELAKPEA